MPAEIAQFFCRSDNYGVLVHDPSSGATAAIDAPEEGPIVAELKTRGWRLTHILTTHHHGDHTAGNLALKAAFGCRIVGPAAEAAKIPGIDEGVAEGDRFAVGAIDVEVLETPGHTLGHVSYLLPETQTVFVGDTLFAIGCGRLLEGTAPMMWASLAKLAALPKETVVYCGHEYTEANARFAVTIEPYNIDLQGRAIEVAAIRAAGRPTLPTTIGLERATNPFLRADRPRLQNAIGMKGSDPADVFAEIRRRKDNFK